MVSSVAFAFADDIVVLDVARFVQGIGGAASWAGALGWLIGTAPRERRGQYIGTALAAAVAGALFGPVIGAAAGALGQEPVFGAVAVVSGKISGSTETATIFVEKQYEHFNVSGAYAAALVLAVLALMTLFAMNFVQRRERTIVSPATVAEPTLHTAGPTSDKEAPDGHQG